MAYQTGTATGVADLISKLFTFATGATAAWTQDELDTYYGTIHKNNCYVSFRWSNSGSVNTLAVYNSLGWASSLEPHQQQDDSGAGAASAVITSGRRVNFESVGPFTAYHFFASDSAPFYIHVAVEVDSGRFRHFGFGELNKYGTWTGGEYAYAHFWDQATGGLDNPLYAVHSFGLDNIYNSFDLGGTIHVEGVGAQGVDEKWGMSCNRFGTASTDRAGEIRRTLTGGARGGFWAHYLAWIHQSNINAYKPLSPIPVVYRDQATAPDTWIWLGEQPDVAIVNMFGFAAGDEITVGSDTWTVFPWVRKQYLENDTEESWNAGIAYKKIT